MLVQNRSFVTISQQFLGAGSQSCQNSSQRDRIKSEMSFDLLANAASSREIAHVDPRKMA